jgi:hypothetical protein
MKQIAKIKKELDNEIEKNIFTFNFSSKAEKNSFLSEYLNDIYSNLLEDEKNSKIKPLYGYMEKQVELKPMMRAILIDWLIEVHSHLRFKEETLYQTIWIIDAYLTTTPIAMNKFQLLGVAALLISSKEHEIYYPKLQQFIDTTDNAYTKEELCQMEIDIVLKLKFDIISPTPVDFYNIISKSYDFDKKKYYLGKYFMESGLLDYDLLKYPPSVIGVACAYITMKFFGDKNYKEFYKKNILNEKNPKMVFKDASREICHFMQNLHNSNLRVVRDKYSSPAYLNVAQYCNSQ